MPKYVLIFALAFLTACSTTVPVRDFPGNSISQVQNDPLSDEQIYTAIVKACVKLGWQCTKKNDHLVKGVLNIRKHQLVVDIEYDQASFDVKYVDSTNLKYDGEKIHRQYVNWSNNLIRYIQSELVTL